MKERPILFSTDMVRAILDGRKTVTRRVINVKGFDWIHEDKFVHVENPKEGVSEVWWDVIRGGPTCVDQDYAYMNCPYGKCDDLLYVRETFSVAEPHLSDQDWPTYKFKASEDKPELTKWKPSIFMPKKAARIWLKVNGIRVEKVQEIPMEEVFTEGVKIPVSNMGKPLINVSEKYQIATYMDEDMSKWETEDFVKAHFAKLWDSINKSRGYGWEKNPWVWAVDFEVVSTNGKPEVANA